MQLTTTEPKSALGRQYLRDMKNAAEVLRGISSRGEISGIGGLEVRWHLVGGSNMPNLESTPQAVASFGDQVALSVASFAVKADSGTTYAISSPAATDELIPTPIMYTDVSNGKNCDLLSAFESYKVMRTGGRDAPVDTGSLQNVRTLMDFYFNGYKNVLVAEVVVALPVSQIEGNYKPNYVFLLQGFDGEYGAGLVVDDRLISRERGFLVPQKPGYAFLMDYSDPKDLHYLEITPTTEMDRIQLAGLESNFNYSVIFLQPIKDAMKFIIPPELLGIGSGSGYSHGRGNDVFGGSGLRSYGGSELMKRGRISRADISDARQDTGSASGLATTRVERVGDTSRSAIMLLVRTIGVRTEEAIV